MLAFSPLVVDEELISCPTTAVHRLRNVVRRDKINEVLGVVDRLHVIRHPREIRRITCTRHKMYQNNGCMHASSPVLWLDPPPRSLRCRRSGNQIPVSNSTLISSNLGVNVQVFFPPEWGSSIVYPQICRLMPPLFLWEA